MSLDLLVCNNTCYGSWVTYSWSWVTPLDRIPAVVIRVTFNAVIVCRALTEGHRRNLRGVLGYRYPTFLDEKVKNLLSPAVNRGDLRILNYNKTVFGRDSAPYPAGRAHVTLLDPRV